MKYKDYTKNDLDISVLRDYLKDKVTTSEDNSVKNYKVMCDLLKEDVMVGDSKKHKLIAGKDTLNFTRKDKSLLLMRYMKNLKLHQIKENIDILSEKRNF